MSKELDKKEGTSVQEKKENGQRGKSRSRAAFRERNGGQAKARTDEAPGTPKHGLGKAAAALLALAAAICVGGYIYHAVGYRDAYLPHTVINGMDVSGRTAAQVKEMMASGVKDYSLVLKLRGGGQEAIYGADIGLHTVFDGSLEEIIRQQNPYAWPRYLLKGPSYDIQTMITCTGLDDFVSHQFHINKVFKVVKGQVFNPVSV